MDGTTTVGVGGGRRWGSRTALVVPLVLALLLGALSVLVLLPAAQHLRSLRGGERAQATLRTGGSCVLGRCQVEFEAAGRIVTGDLPVGSGGGKSPVGARTAVRHRADDPRVVAREEDLGGGAAAVGTVTAGGAALFFLVLPILAARYRRRSTAPRVDRPRIRA
ncbi:hypothetical protein [Streptomyces virginiae]|uniref:hypothetical protein n=1 Tax=Streptomyces virginiae TaxID=1961 RepID=UPI0022537A4C|nr:hypothetical protein [Streptomyces virginiae]MCX5271389.1 hypothetical protein [Streptomyces virginiae]